MKKVIFLMLAMTLSLGLISCSSDDDNSNVPEFTIVGTWKVTAQYINNTQQDISSICAFKGNVKFISGGTYTEDVWEEEQGVPCHLEETIGGTWVKNGNNYNITISTVGGQSILPGTITPITENGVINKFEITGSSLGTTTRLVFTKQ